MCSNGTDCCLLVRWRPLPWKRLTNNIFPTGKSITGRETNLQPKNLNKLSKFALEREYALPDIGRELNRRARKALRRGQYGFVQVAMMGFRHIILRCSGIPEDETNIYSLASAVTSQQRLGRDVRNVDASALGVFEVYATQLVHTLLRHEHPWMQYLGADVCYALLACQDYFVDQSKLLSFLDSLLHMLEDDLSSYLDPTSSSRHYHHSISRAFRRLTCHGMVRKRPMNTEDENWRIKGRMCLFLSMYTMISKADTASLQKHAERTLPILLLALEECLPDYISQLRHLVVCLPAYQSIDTFEPIEAVNKPDQFSQLRNKAAFVPLLDIAISRMAITTSSASQELVVHSVLEFLDSRHWMDLSLSLHIARLLDSTNWYTRRMFGMDLLDVFSEEALKALMRFFAVEQPAPFHHRLVQRQRALRKLKETLETNPGSHTEDDTDSNAPQLQYFAPISRDELSLVLQAYESPALSLVSMADPNKRSSQPAQAASVDSLETWPVSTVWDSAFDLHPQSLRRTLINSVNSQNNDEHQRASNASTNGNSLGGSGSCRDAQNSEESSDKLFCTCEYLQQTSLTFLPSSRAVHYDVKPTTSSQLSGLVFLHILRHLSELGARWERAASEGQSILTASDDHQSTSDKTYGSVEQQIYKEVRLEISNDCDSGFDRVETHATIQKSKGTEKRLNHNHTQVDTSHCHTAPNSHAPNSHAPKSGATSITIQTNDLNGERASRKSMVVSLSAVSPHRDSIIRSSSNSMARKNTSASSSPSCARQRSMTAQEEKSSQTSRQTRMETIMRRGSTWDTKSVSSATPTLTDMRDTTFGSIMTPIKVGPSDDLHTVRETSYRLSLPTNPRTHGIPVAWSRASGQPRQGKTHLSHMGSTFSASVKTTKNGAVISRWRAHILETAARIIAESLALYPNQNERHATQNCVQEAIEYILPHLLDLPAEVKSCDLSILKKNGSPTVPETAFACVGSLLKRLHTSKALSDCLHSLCSWYADLQTELYGELLVESDENVSNDCVSSNTTAAVHSSPSKQIRAESPGIASVVKLLARYGDLGSKSESLFSPSPIFDCGRLRILDVMLLCTKMHSMQLYLEQLATITPRNRHSNGTNRASSKPLLRLMRKTVHLVTNKQKTNHANVPSEFRCFESVARLFNREFHACIPAEESTQVLLRELLSEQRWLRTKSMGILYTSSTNPWSWLAFYCRVKSNVRKVDSTPTQADLKNQVTKQSKNDIQLPLPDVCATQIDHVQPSQRAPPPPPRPDKSLGAHKHSISSMMMSDPTALVELFNAHAKYATNTGENNISVDDLARTLGLLITTRDHKSKVATEQALHHDETILSKETDKHLEIDRLTKCRPLDFPQPLKSATSPNISMFTLHSLLSAIVFVLCDISGVSMFDADTETTASMQNLVDDNAYNVTQHASNDSKQMNKKSIQTSDGESKTVPSQVSSGGRNEPLLLNPNAACTLVWAVRLVVSILDNVGISAFWYVTQLINQLRHIAAHHRSDISSSVLMVAHDALLLALAARCDAYRFTASGMHISAKAVAATSNRRTVSPVTSDTTAAHQCPAEICEQQTDASTLLLERSILQDAMQLRMRSHIPCILATESGTIYEWTDRKDNRHSAVCSFVPLSGGLTLCSYQKSINSTRDTKDSCPTDFSLNYLNMQQNIMKRLAWSIPVQGALKHLLMSIREHQTVSADTNDTIDRMTKLKELLPTLERVFPFLSSDFSFIPRIGSTINLDYTDCMRIIIASFKNCGDFTDDIAHTGTDSHGMAFINNNQISNDTNNKKKTSTVTSRSDTTTGRTIDETSHVANNINTTTENIDETSHDASNSDTSTKSIDETSYVENKNTTTETIDNTTTETIDDTTTKTIDDTSSSSNVLQRQAKQTQSERNDSTNKRNKSSNHIQSTDSSFDQTTFSPVHIHPLLQSPTSNFARTEKILNHLPQLNICRYQTPNIRWINPLASGMALHVPKRTLLLWSSCLLHVLQQSNEQTNDLNPITVCEIVAPMLFTHQNHIHILTQMLCTMTLPPFPPALLKDGNDAAQYENEENEENVSVASVASTNRNSGMISSPITEMIFRENDNRTTVPVSKTTNVKELKTASSGLKKAQGTGIMFQSNSTYGVHTKTNQISNRIRPNSSLETNPRKRSYHFDSHSVATSNQFRNNKHSSHGSTTSTDLNVSSERMLELHRQEIERIQQTQSMLLEYIGAVQSEDHTCVVAETQAAIDLGAWDSMNSVDSEEENKFNENGLVQHPNQLHIGANSDDSKQHNDTHHENKFNFHDGTNRNELGIENTIETHSIPKMMDSDNSTNMSHVVNTDDHSGSAAHKQKLDIRALSNMFLQA